MQCDVRSMAKKKADSETMPRPGKVHEGESRLFVCVEIPTATFNCQGAAAQAMPLCRFGHALISPRVRLLPELKSPSVFSIFEFF
jgi:hypothetical protein